MARAQKYHKPLSHLVDWVVAEVPDRFRCMRCGATLQMRVPINMAAWKFYSEGFNCEHKDCQPATAEKRA